MFRAQQQGVPKPEDDGPGESRGPLDPRKNGRTLAGREAHFRDMQAGPAPVRRKTPAYVQIGTRSAPVPRPAAHVNVPAATTPEPLGPAPQHSGKTGFDVAARVWGHRDEDGAFIPEGHAHTTSAVTVEDRPAEDQSAIHATVGDTDDELAPEVPRDRWKMPALAMLGASTLLLGALAVWGGQKPGPESAPPPPATTSLVSSPTPAAVVPPPPPAPQAEPPRPAAKLAPAQEPPKPIPPKRTHKKRHDPDAVLKPSF